jgi:hypothetical protein
LDDDELPQDDFDDDAATNAKGISKLERVAVLRARMEEAISQIKDSGHADVKELVDAITETKKNGMAYIQPLAHRRLRLVWEQGECTIVLGAGCVHAACDRGMCGALFVSARGVVAELPSPICISLGAPRV